MPDYELSVGPIYKQMSNPHAPMENDPERIADLLVRLTDGDDLPRRLVLGRDALAYVERVEAARSEEMKAYQDMTLGTSG